MSTAVEVVIAVVVTALVVAWMSGMAIGVEAWLTGEKFERCPSCHRYGLTSDGTRHPEGCPVGPMHTLSATSTLAHLRVRRH